MASAKLTVGALSADWPRSTLLIAVTVVGIFVLQLVLAPAACFDATYPALCAELALLRYSTWLGVLLMPFLHGSWLHLGSNVLTFLVFGGATEAFYGRRLLLWLFTTAGYLSTEIQLLDTLAADQTPVTVGIGGAVFGLGAFIGVMLCPTSRSGLVALVREARGPEIPLRPPLLVMGLLSITYAVLTHLGVVPIDARAATLSHLVGASFGAGTAAYRRAIDLELSISSLSLLDRN